MKMAPKDANAQANQKVKRSADPIEAADEVVQRKQQKVTDEGQQQQQQQVTNGGTDTPPAEEDATVKKLQNRVNYERVRLANVLEREPEFWKIGKPKYPMSVTLHCNRCRLYNYNLQPQERFRIVQSPNSQEFDRVEFVQSLCRGCVLMNLDLEQMMFKHLEATYPENMAVLEKAENKKEC